ncbi:MAG: L,D-transpeptidase [Jatrophihabitans sp.]|uniref:L,D-transpeptidase n=1 Tax=Jatrophihabitans sp. TaxID=1932789 RepID=UPI003F7DB1F3
MTKPTRSRVAALSAVFVSLVLVLSACSSSSSGGTATTSGTSTSATSTTDTSSAPTSTAPSTSTPPPKPKVMVHIKTLNADGATYGVAMPIIVYFQHRIASAKDFAAATKVTVNGQPQVGAWYFEGSDANKGYPVEGHWRPEHYWTPHSKVHVDLPMKGVSGGGDYVFDNSLTLDFFIGAQHLGTVDDSGSPHTLKITNDGKPYGTFPVSLGANQTRTRSGIKVIMEQVPTTCMHDTNGSYYECGIKFDQRLTYDGEYLHAAPWNIGNIESGVDTSNGCTNLLPADAEKLFHFLQIGDPIEYPNANGPRMQLGDGYGDWNVPWGVWQQGGLISTT